MNIVRVLLSLATQFDWDLQQFDVKNAFLYGELKEEIYMDLRFSFNMHLQEKKGMLTEKSFVWAKTISTILVWKICQSHDNCWLQTKPRRPHLIC